MARTPSKSKTIKNIPNSEIEMVACYTKPNELGNKYIITKNQVKGQFTLWKCIEDGVEKISTSKNPIDFDEIIPYEK